MKTKIANILLVFILALFGLSSTAQTKKVLFIGNSYTYVNNLPKIIADLALSVNDTLIYNSSTPGGYTLQGHSTNATTLGKIAEGDWDFVILQEQSQRPSLPIEQVEADVFPYAHKLDSLINISNPCGETVFFMTWGRKNGDASNCGWWPPVCTYQGMDSLLNLRYMMMADSNNALVSPVGAVWHYIRDYYPTIELYSTDESHPSAAGSYAAACTFYTVFFRKDPNLLSYDLNLLPIDAERIRLAAKAMVYDSLINWHIGEYDHSIDFSFYPIGTWDIQFINESQNANGQLWDFGSETSTAVSPVHTFPGMGNYPITLYSYSNCDTLIMTQNVSIYYPEVSSVALNTTNYFYPNPAKDFISLLNVKGNIVSVKIYDISGKIVLSIKEITHGKIDVSSLEKGIYLIRVGQKAEIQKLIIE